MDLVTSPVQHAFIENRESTNTLVAELRSFQENTRSGRLWATLGWSSATQRVISDKNIWSINRLLIQHKSRVLILRAAHRSCDSYVPKGKYRRSLVKSAQNISIVDSTHL